MSLSKPLRASPNLELGQHKSLVRQCTILPEPNPDSVLCSAGLVLLQMCLQDMARGWHEQQCQLCQSGVGAALLVQDWAEGVPEASWGSAVG